MGNSWNYRYDTGWINRDDWTNVHLGSDTTLNTDSNVTHNLNAPLSNLLVKLWYSTDGTDANSVEVSQGFSFDAADRYGWNLYAVDNNNVKVQTAEDGLIVANDSGVGFIIDTENYYYKVKIWYIG